MKKFRLVIVAAIAAVSLTSVFAAPAGEFVTPAQISSAQSTADHQSIANSYEVEAAVYDKRVDWHQSMAKSYAASGAKGPQQQMVRHCQQLAAKFRSIAQEYHEMATIEHNAMATNEK